MRRIYTITMILAFVCLLGCHEKENKNNIIRKNQVEEIHEGPFGSCCDEMSDCMKQSNALIRIEENGTLFLTIGYMQTEQGTAWFDQAIIYCPFCGKKLQSRQDLANKAN